MKKETAVLPLIYDLLLWISPKIGHFPQKYKYTLGNRLTNTMLDILELVIEAKFTSKKKAHFLRKANLSLEKLRFLLRLAKDLQCMNIKSYEYIARQINEIGKMVGGWEKQQKEKENGA